MTLKSCLGDNPLQCDLLFLFFQEYDGIFAPDNHAYFLVVQMWEYLIWYARLALQQSIQYVRENSNWKWIWKWVFELTHFLYKVDYGKKQDEVEREKMKRMERANGKF